MHGGEYSELLPLNEMLAPYFAGAPLLPIIVCVLSYGANKKQSVFLRHISRVSVKLCIPGRGEPYAVTCRVLLPS